MKNQRVAFFGTSKYCLPVLEALKNLPAGRQELVLVITREDKPVGRKQILTPSPVKQWAIKNGIKVDSSGVAASLLIAPPTAGLQNDEKVDLAIVADYGKIIKHEVYEKPKLGTFNIHFSKLPELRGPSPVQSTLLRGDKTAWITIYKLKYYPELEIKMDSGPILWQKEYPILPDDTTESLYTRLFQEVAKEIPEIINSLAACRLPLISQDHSKATFCKMLTKDDGFIEWDLLKNSMYVACCDRNMIPTSRVEKLYNQYRAMYPWPGIWTIKDGRRMKILKCHLEKEKIVLDEIQFEGKTPEKYKN